VSELISSPLTCGDVSFERGDIAQLAAGLELALEDLGIKDRSHDNFGRQADHSTCQSWRARSDELGEKGD